MGLALLALLLHVRHPSTGAPASAADAEPARHALVAFPADEGHDPARSEAGRRSRTWPTRAEFQSTAAIWLGLLALVTLTVFGRSR